MPRMMGRLSPCNSALFFQFGVPIYAASVSTSFR